MLRSIHLHELRAIALLADRVAPFDHRLATRTEHSLEGAGIIGLSRSHKSFQCGLRRIEPEMSRVLRRARLGDFSRRALLGRRLLLAAG